MSDPATQPQYTFYVAWKCKCHGFKEVILDFEDHDIVYGSVREAEGAAYVYCKRDHEQPDSDHTSEKYYVSIWQKGAQLVKRYELHFFKLDSEDEAEEGEMLP